MLSSTRQDKDYNRSLNNWDFHNKKTGKLCDNLIFIINEKKPSKLSNDVLLN